MLKMGDYNYRHFSRRILGELEDESFSGPAAGDQSPDFKAVMLSGERVRLSDYQGRSNVLLVFGSATCPFTAASIAGINSLHDSVDSGDVRILFVYVREAHPGERIPAHRSLRDKASAARLLADEEEMEMPIIVDDVHGSIHRKYSRLPNPAFLIDKAGRIAFRMRWTKPQELAAAIRELLEAQTDSGNDHAIVHGGQELSPPLSYDRLHAFRAVERGGEESVRDFHAVFGRFSRLSLSLPQAILQHPGRILAVTALAGAALAGGLYAGFELRKRRLGVRRNPYRAYEKEKRDTETGTDYGAVGI
ncbi:MAG TPA: deiodinase-like protein [Candidatus Angelobacter sp.]|nr:deiodinase-like protein [Candidatus Angelobacter sp.]